MAMPQSLGYFSRAMSPPGSRQKPTVSKIEPRRAPPSDVKARMLEAQERARADTRTEAQRWLGDPPRDRSALAQRVRRWFVKYFYAQLMSALPPKADMCSANKNVR